MGGVYSKVSKDGDMYIDLVGLMCSDLSVQLGFKTKASSIIIQSSSLEKL